MSSTPDAPSPASGSGPTLRGRAAGPRAPLLTGGLAAALLFGSYLLGLHTFGAPTGGGWLELEGQPLYRHVYGRMALVVSVLTGYMLVASTELLRGARRDLEALRPHLRGPADAVDALTARLAPHAPGARRAGSLAALLAPCLMVATEGTLAIFTPARISFGTLWSLAANGMLFYLLGASVHRTLGQAEVFRRAAERMQLDPVDPSPVLTFGRRGLRAALLWIGGASLAAFLLASPNFVAPVTPVLLGTLAVAGAGFLGPVRGGHALLTRLRARELAALRPAIARERAELLAGGVAARLPSLLAWESRVADLPVWPFDASLRLRGALFVLLPLGSWVGGAMVERLLGALLD